LDVWLCFGPEAWATRPFSSFEIDPTNLSELLSAGEGSELWDHFR
jgi:hypothetical protein